MFAIAFDIIIVDTAQHHPKGVSQIGFMVRWSPVASYGERTTQTIAFYLRIVCCQGHEQVPFSVRR